MALLAHQPQVSCPSVCVKPKAGAKGTKVRSTVAFRLVDKSKKLASLRLRSSVPYSRCQPISSSKGKPFQVVCFKGNYQNDELNGTRSSSKSKSPVQQSCTQEGREEIIAKSPDIENHPIPFVCEDKEVPGAGSLAIRRLFKKWLLNLRAQTSFQTDEVLSERATQNEMTEDQKVTLSSEAVEVMKSAVVTLSSEAVQLMKSAVVTLSSEAVQLMKSAVVKFLRLDLAISLPLLIIISSYLTVKLMYGSEATEDLALLWIFGPPMMAGLIKLIQAVCSFYVFCFKLAVSFVRSLTSPLFLVYNFIAEGKLWKFVIDIIYTDYKEVFRRKKKQFTDGLEEKIKDYFEARWPRYWPIYWKTVRFLKVAKFM